MKFLDPIPWAEEMEQLRTGNERLKAELAEAKKDVQIGKEMLGAMMAEIADWRDALECEKTHGARRNFVLGAKWWQAYKHGATAFASEVDEMEREAASRYGLPQKFKP